MKKVKTIGLFELMQMFTTKESAVKYFEKIRWNNKVCCSKCSKDTKIKQQKDKVNYWCGECRNYFNVFTNTPFERNKVDIKKVLFACYLMLTSRKGIGNCIIYST